MSFKARLFATAAVVAMAAAAIYGSTLEKPEVVEEEILPLSWFSSEKETIYFWYSDEELTNYINSAAVSFGEREGVRVIPVLASDSEYLEVVNRETLHADKFPDAYLLSNDSLEKAYLAGLAAEVEDVRSVCNAEYFPQAALDAVTYHGKIIGYPLYFETSALVYNATYMEEWARQQAVKELSGAGEQVDWEEGTVTEMTEEVELDETAVAAKMQEYLQKGMPTTMNDILNIADTFDAPEGVEGVMKWDVSDIFYNYWIVGNYMIVGGDAGDDEQNMNINNTSTVQCLEVYKALNQFFSIESETVDYDAVLQDFIEGKVVFTIGTTDVVERLEQAKAEGSFVYEYGVLTMPEVSEKLRSRSLSVTNAVVINGYSEHEELANEFAAYLTGDYAEGLYEKTGKIASNRQVNEANEALQVFAEEYAESVPLPKMMETGNFWLQLEVLFSRVWNGEDVTNLVKELAASLNNE